MSFFLQGHLANANSNLANLLFVGELSKRLAPRGVTVNAIQTGNKVGESRLQIHEPSSTFVTAEFAHFGSALLRTPHQRITGQKDTKGSTRGK